VRLKRVFVEEDGISDALLAELDRSRDGAMRVVVAIIQAEQLCIIRPDRDRIVVCRAVREPARPSPVCTVPPGWPSTTRSCAAKGCVVAPIPATPGYVSGVLPSLEASDIQQTDLASLHAGEACQGHVDDPDTARVKGSAEMAVVLRRAVAGRIGWPDEDLALSLGAARIAIPLGHRRGAGRDRPGAVRLPRRAAADERRPGGGRCGRSRPRQPAPEHAADLDCGDVVHRRFVVLPPDPHGLDGSDDDGVGCRS
jgi:hypothetical protein